MISDEIAACGGTTAISLGLPSTTAVPAERSRLSKDSFYRHTKVNAQLRIHFVEDIKGIHMLAIIRENETGIQTGLVTEEIDVVGLDCATAKEPTEVMTHIAHTREELSRRACRVLFVCSHGETCTLAVYRDANVKANLYESKLYTGQTITSSQTRVELFGDNLDQTWDAICSQVILDEVQSRHVDQRIGRHSQIIDIKKEIQRLTKAHAKAVQIPQRNKLWEQLQKAKKELSELQGEDI